MLSLTHLCDFLSVTMSMVVTSPASDLLACLGRQAALPKQYDIVDRRQDRPVITDNGRLPASATSALVHRLGLSQAQRSPTVPGGVESLGLDDAGLIQLIRICAVPGP